MDKKEKYNNEEKFVANILKQCTNDTYVETFMERGAVYANVRQYVSHHVLPSGLHVYVPIAEPGSEQEHELHIKDPFNLQYVSHRSFYIVTEELSREELNKNPRNIDYLVRGHIGIEYNYLHNPDNGIVFDSINYGILQEFNNAGIAKNASWIISVYLDLKKNSTLDQTRFNMGVKGVYDQIINLDQSITDILVEKIQKSKLSENDKLKYIEKVKKLAEMLKAEKHLQENDTLEEKKADDAIELVTESEKREEDFSPEQNNSDKTNAKITQILDIIEGLPEEEMDCLFRELQTLRTRGKQESQQQNNPESPEEWQQ